MAVVANCIALSACGNLSVGACNSLYEDEFYLIYYQIMKATVTQLLREFPRIRRAAMRGDRVVIETRSGNLVLIREVVEDEPIFGCLKSMATDNGLAAHEHVFAATDWDRAR